MKLSKKNCFYIIFPRKKYYENVVLSSYFILFTFTSCLEKKWKIIVDFLTHFTHAKKHPTKTISRKIFERRFTQISAINIFELKKIR